MKLKNSLQYRFLTSLLVGGILITLLGGMYIFRLSLKESEAQLIWDGQALTSALNHAVMVAHNQGEVQHVIEEVFRETPGIEHISIVKNEKIVASSETGWIGLAQSEIPDSDIRAILSSSEGVAGTELAKTHSHDAGSAQVTHPESASILQGLPAPSQHKTMSWQGIPVSVIQAPLDVHLDRHEHNHSNIVIKAREDAYQTPSYLANIDSDYIGSNAGQIILLLDRTRVSQVTMANMLRIAGGFAGGVLLVMLFSYLVMRKQVLVPLQAITETMRQRRLGDKKVRATVIGRDELSRVGETLNNMLDVLGRNEQELHQLTQAVEQSPASVVITDPQAVIQYANRQYCLITGYSKDELIGQRASIIKSGLAPKEVYNKLWETISSGKIWQGELPNRNKNGELYWENISISPIFDAQGEVSQFLGMQEDITVRKEYEAKLNHQANFDDLTGLPNRLLAQDRLNQAIASAHRAGKDHKVALLVLDLDDFKKINDTLGHDVGDQLLCEVAGRFQTSTRETDTVARFGGDEFMIVMTDVNSQADVECVAEKLLEKLKTPFNLGGMQFFINASIGIAMYPDDGVDVTHLLQDADAAMNRAKEAGRARFSFFTPAMNDEAVEHMQMEQALQMALENNELEVHFQPVICCTTGTIVGAEALLRWKHPELGMVPPFKFIPLAERTNLIQKIGKWVLRESCRIAAYWVEENNGNFRIAVNLSAKQFDGRKLFYEVCDALEDSGLSPKNLELEFTESVLMREDEETMQVIRDLHGMGIRFAIDDFGTGYSSISYLRNYPFDTLKIDRSFIVDMTSKTGDGKLVSSIVAMADSLALEVVAEGIEEIDQFIYLREIKAQRCQGWLFSKALPEREFTEQMRSWQVMPALRKDCEAQNPVLVKTNH